jgi:light-regulated signal transduction histidine kinase (bacteriophytochrome)
VAPQPSSAFLAEFRHDLANPVNHVVGYAELLMMGATERQVTELQPPLEAISKCAAELRRHLDEHLPLIRIRTQDVDLPLVSSSVVTTANELLVQVESLKPRIRGAWKEAEEDLLQIEQAAYRLLELVKKTA